MRERGSRAEREKEERGRGMESVVNRQRWRERCKENGRSEKGLGQNIVDDQTE